MFLDFIDPITKLFCGDSTLPYVIQIIIRLLLATVLASILGIERANKRHAAGLRTFIVVSLVATISATIDIPLINSTGITFPFISAATAIGISIIASYTILYSSKNQIKGLTTAVTLWGQAFIGLAIGFGLYTISLIGFTFLLLSINLLPKMEIYLKNRSNHFDIHIEFKHPNDIAKFVTIVRELGINVDDLELNPAYYNSGLYVYTVSLTIYKKELKKFKTHDEIIQSLKTLDYVSFIEEISL